MPEMLLKLTLPPAVTSAPITPLSASHRRERSPGLPASEEYRLPLHTPMPHTDCLSLPHLFVTTPPYVWPEPVSLLDQMGSLYGSTSDAAPTVVPLNVVR